VSTKAQRIARRKVALQRLGFRVNTKTRYRQAIRDFQRSQGLTPSGWIRSGSRTEKVLFGCEARNKAGKPDLSTHFRYSEFLCKCGGRYASCRRIWVKRSLVRRLEQLRKETGPVQIVSGCRCDTYNASIGGASLSQHRKGRAADLGQTVTLSKMRSLKLFSGIGTSRSSGKVAHVDVRLGGSRWTPTLWYYT